MTKKLGIVMDPIQGISISKDSSFAMLLEAQSRGWQINYMQQSDIALCDGVVTASTRRLSVEDNPDRWFDLSEPENTALGSLDIILMRKDPPFDMEFVYTTYLLELAEEQGSRVINRPAALRNYNEKLSTARFPQCCAPTLVARRHTDFMAFLTTHRHIVIKPLDSMGGESVFMVHENDNNRNVIIETLTDHGRRFAMAQRYLPEIVSGDKRILLINGSPIPYALIRMPAAGDSRGNLAAGATTQGTQLTDRDYWLCEQVAPALRDNGLIFVGLDIIGNYITEINITSPTCIRELDNIYGINIAGTLFDFIEKQIEK